MNKKGFTLIELMIVIAIIGILLAILTPLLDLEGSLQLVECDNGASYVAKWNKIVHLRNGLHITTTEGKTYIIQSGTCSITDIEGE